MLTPQQIRSFHKNGYLLIPNVLSPEEVRSLQEFFRPLFHAPSEKRFPGDSDKVLFDIYSRHPKIRWLLFHEPTIKILKSLLGDDYVVLREASAHFNLYSPWHKDTSTQEKEGQTFHWQEDYLMIEVAYYLQDNIQGVGGGLDVQPGSHLTPDASVKTQVERRSLLQSISRRIDGFLLRLGNSLHRRLGLNIKKVLSFRVWQKDKSVSIPSKAGDLVLFHFRINHRGTPQLEGADVAGRDKLAIFLACSKNNSHVSAYHNFIHSRPDYVYLQNFAYPADLQDQAKAAGLNLV